MHLSRTLKKPVRMAALAATTMCLAVCTVSAPASARPHSDCQAPDKIEPKSLAFVVRYVERRPGGDFLVTFENGEVWKQTDRSASVQLERGEQVVIRRATTGKFTLVSRSGQSTHVERVH